MAEKAVKKKRAEEAAALAGPAVSPGALDGNRDPGTVVDPSPSPRRESSSSSVQKSKAKKKESDKPKSSVVHHEDLQRHFHVFEEKLFSRFTVMFNQPRDPAVTPVPAAAAQGTPDLQSPCPQPQQQLTPHQPSTTSANIHSQPAGVDHPPSVPIQPQLTPFLAPSGFPQSQGGVPAPSCQPAVNDQAQGSGSVLVDQATPSQETWLQPLTVSVDQGPPITMLQTLHPDHQPSTGASQPPSAPLEADLLSPQPAASQQGLLGNASMLVPDIPSLVSNMESHWNAQEAQEDCVNPLSGLKGLEGLELTGFAPAITRPRKKLQPLDIMEAMWEHARGGATVQKVQVDKVLHAQDVDEGGFLAHEPPQGLLNSSKVIDADNALKAAQQQQCALGLILAKGLTNLNNIVAKVNQAVSEGQGLSPAEAKDLSAELSAEASRPFSQALRVVASKANDFHMRRKDRIVEALKYQDEVLANTVKITPLGHRSFFATDITEHIKEATNRASIKAMIRASNPKPHTQHHAKGARHHPYTRPDSRHTHAGTQSEPRQGGYRSKEHGNQRPFHEGRPGRQGKGRQPSKGKHQHKQHSKQDSGASKDF